MAASARVCFCVLLKSRAGTCYTFLAWNSALFQLCWEVFNSNQGLKYHTHTKLETNTESASEQHKVSHLSMSHPVSFRYHSSHASIWCCSADSEAFTPGEAHGIKQNKSAMSF